MANPNAKQAIETNSAEGEAMVQSQGQAGR
jgi:hypothetical protein